MKNLNWWIIGGAAVATTVGGYFAYKHFTKPAPASGYSRYSEPKSKKLNLRKAGPGALVFGN